MVLQCKGVLGIEKYEMKNNREAEVEDTDLDLESEWS